MFHHHGIFMMRYFARSAARPVEPVWTGRIKVHATPPRIIATESRPGRVVISRGHSSGPTGNATTRPTGNALLQSTSVTRRTPRNRSGNANRQPSKNRRRNGRPRSTRCWMKLSMKPFRRPIQWHSPHRRRPSRPRKGLGNPRREGEPEAGWTAPVP